jgi:hypothetical protein
MIKNMYWSAFKVPRLFLSDFDKKKFLDRFSKNAQISTFIKVRLVGTEMFHVDRETDRRTDMTKLIVAFRNFANASNRALQLLFKCGS